MTKVIVVGAGAAGLKAASDLLDVGLQVDLIEARDRLGGRAFTDSSLGVPIDLGCQWLHDAPDNPWVVEAKRLKIETSEQVKNDFYFDPDDLSQARSEKCGTLVEKLEWKIESALMNDHTDSAAANAVTSAKLASDNPWYPVAEAMLAGLEESAELSEFSAIDHHAEDVELPYKFETSNSDRSNYLPRGGYGALIGAYGKDLIARHGDKGTKRLSVFLSRQVTQVHRASNTLTVKSQKVSGGSALQFKPRAVLLAVPTSIIAAQKLKFVPPLPLVTARAFAKLPLGHFTKVALLFTHDIFSVESYATKISLEKLEELRKTFPKVQKNDEVWPLPPSDTKHTWKFISNLHGKNVVVGFVGGALAKQLEQESDNAVIQHALDRLTTTLGPVLGPHVKGMYAKRAVVSRWDTDPWSLGAYSYTAPGGKGARSHLYQQPMSDELIFFAGEALWQNSYGTAHGAYYTGAAAAAAMLEALGY